MIQIKFNFNLCRTENRNRPKRWGLLAQIVENGIKKKVWVSGKDKMVIGNKKLPTYRELMFG